MQVAELSRPGYIPPGAELDGLSDHDLLAGVAADQRLLNLLEASRQRKVVEFHARRTADYKARKAQEPHFTMPPLRETAVEVAPLIGATEGKVKSDLRVTRSLQRDFPGVWALVESGQLDLYRAAKLPEAADHHLTSSGEVAEFAEAMTAWFAAHLERKRTTCDEGSDPDVGPPGPLVTKTSRQIGNRISYLVKKLRPKDAEDRFRRKYQRRSARVDSLGDGMSQLQLTHDVVSLQAVDYRLTLIAKAMRREGDSRTLEQLRTDLAVDLLLGRLTVGAETGEFEHPETSATGDPLDTVHSWPTPRYARPVINVTVPIQTLMGLRDEPGVLSGGESVPAGLVRAIGADSDSTWYRMLTDPARGCVELSTKSYKPTAPIVRQVVADFGTCFAPVCSVSATDSEIDHRVRAPEGATSTENLGPGCKGHHQAKHAPGFGLARTATGDLVFTTRAGFAHAVEKAEQPVGDGWGDPAIWDGEFTLAELRDALSYLAHERARIESSASWVRELEQSWADYRASYPDATEAEISGWIHDDDPFAPPAPPILRKGTTLEAVLESEKPRLDTRGMDDETLYDLHDIA